MLELGQGKGNLRAMTEVDEDKIEYIAKYVEATYPQTVHRIWNCSGGHLREVFNHNWTAFYANLLAAIERKYVTELLVMNGVREKEAVFLPGAAKGWTYSMHERNPR